MRLQTGAMLVALLAFGVLAGCGSSSSSDTSTPAPAVATITCLQYPTSTMTHGASPLPCVGGGMATGGFQHFAITGVASNTPYSISLSGMSADFDLFIATNGTFSAVACSSQLAGTANDSCSVTTTGNTFFIEVDAYSTATTSRFTLGIAP